MNSDDLKSRTWALRATGSTPKQIARTLGIPRSRVVSLLHGHASPPPNHLTAQPDASTRPGNQLIGCWITRQWSNGLDIDQRPPDWIDDTDLPPLAMGAGLTSIAVARHHNDTEVSICGYLVDTYCQGVKNAIPPNILDRRDLPAFLADFFHAYPSDPLPAPLTLAQDIVLGAVDYPEASASTHTPTSTPPNHTSAPGNHPAASDSASTAGPTFSKAPTTTPPASCAPSTER